MEGQAWQPGRCSLPNLSPRLRVILEARALCRGFYEHTETNEETEFVWAVNTALQKSLFSSWGPAMQELGTWDAIS